MLLKLVMVPELSVMLMYDFSIFAKRRVFDGVRRTSETEKVQTPLINFTTLTMTNAEVVRDGRRRPAAASARSHIRQSLSLHLQLEVSERESPRVAYNNLSLAQAH